MKSSILIVLPVFLLFLIVARVFAGGDEVVVLYNQDMPGSKAVADHYAAARQVPSAQVFGLSLSTNEVISRYEFIESLQNPLLDRLESTGLWTFGKITVPATQEHAAVVMDRVIRSKIRYLALCYGVPLKIAEDYSLPGNPHSKLPVQFRHNQAAVDSELATLPAAHLDISLEGPLPNPFYCCTNPLALNPTNCILLVARLDGPSAAIADRLVDKALEAESNGFWGRAYFDARGIQTNDSYYLGDRWILGGAELARRLGFETTVDDQPDTFRPGYPLSHVALYAGWYDTDASGPFAEEHVEFMPGAFAYHLHSYSANTLRSFSSNWVGPLIGRGATCSMGCVYEPYLQFTPNIAFFIEAWGNGFTFGEAAWAAQAGLSWQTTVVGDPLYRPFGRNLEKQHYQLLKQKNPLSEWSGLRLLDMELARGVPPARIANFLARLPQTANSAVLTEKLADLEETLGQPAASITATQNALKLATSPGQRLRLRLTLADRLQAAGRISDEVTDYQHLMSENPAYPRSAEIEAKLKTLKSK